MTLEDTLSKLNKKTRQRVYAASEVKIEKLPTASLGLNNVLSGGLGVARQSLLWGNKSAGKSGLMLQTVAAAQKQGISCAWVDAENSIDPQWCARLGVDTSQLLVAGTRSIDDMTAIVCDLLESNIGLLVVDSISALLPSTYFEKNDELKEGLEGTRQIGTASKELGIAVNKFNYLNKETTLVLISQARNQFNSFGASLKPMGGEAMKYYSSTIVKLWSSPAVGEQILSEETVGDKIVKRPIGRAVTATVEFNKIGPPNQVAEYDFYYDGNNIGINQVGEMVKLAVPAGLIEKSGSWYSLEGQSIQGERNVADWLRQNPDVQEDIRKRLGV